MIKRSGRANSLERYEQWKERQLIDINQIKQSLEYCFRLAKRGKSSGLVVVLLEDFDVADNLLSNLKFRDLKVVESIAGELIFENGAIIKIFTSAEKGIIKNILGQNAEVIVASSGDPRSEKIDKVLSF